MPNLTPSANARGYLTLNSENHAYLDITLNPGTGQLRLTEGPHTGHQLGDGITQVTVQDPTQTIQQETPSGTHQTTYTITLKETG